MKILVLGDDARAHALVWKLFNSSQMHDLVCAPGNGGTSLLVPSAELPPGGAAEICKWAFAERFKLLVPASTSYLLRELADAAFIYGLRVFGSAKRVAVLERNRLWGKEFLLRHALPTPRGRCFSDLATAERYLAGHPLPVVLRGDTALDADGVYADRYAALAALQDLFASPLPEGNLRGVIVEEHVPGARLACSALVDGQTVRTLLPVRLYDQPRTAAHNGADVDRGAHTESSPLVYQLQRYLELKVFRPLLQALAQDQLSPSGMLGVNCTLGPAGPLVTELRFTFADGEVQALLPRLDGDLALLIQAALAGRLEQALAPGWTPQASVALGLSVRGANIGGDVEGLSALGQGVLAFHGQTNTSHGLRYLAGGTPNPGVLGAFAKSFTDAMLGQAAKKILAAGPGMVTTGPHPLMLVAQASSLQEARAQAYASAEQITFPGRSFRPDVGEQPLR